MSWMNQLYQTYENNIGRGQDEELSLTPIAHMNANAQLEVTINAEGDFVSAVEVSKENAVTLIPVTESSAGRSSGVAPHALCDTLSYLAGDYKNYCANDKDKKKANEKFSQYMDNLKKWVESAYTNPKAKAIYSYLMKECMIEDLIKAGLVELTEDSCFSNKKVSGQPYERAIVRFRVLGGDRNYSDKTWEDESLIQAYSQYYLYQQAGEQDICYLIGANRTISLNHPKGIVAANYGAKLVSANDGQGYSYRGRFQSAEQSYALSYEASQKIHSALTWLAKKQGVYVGTQDKRTFICWNPQGKKTPDILDAFVFDGEETESVDIPYKKKLIRIFQGYQEQFEDSDDVIIMGLDAATTGRLSITYYHELKASEFWERILYWGATCNWKYLRFNEAKEARFETETPDFRRIVQCAYGREQGGFIDVDDRVLKEQSQRLLKCMLEKQRLPSDIIQALVIRASTPLAYKKRTNREYVLSTACAMIMKDYYDKNKKDMVMKGEEYFMKLDVENNDRSYLFGRLLAVMEKVERSTYDWGEGREPNAIRLQSAYVNHPMQTWKILEDVLNPYFQKLTPGSREYYRRLISEIAGQILKEDEQVLNQRLKENYLLGYYLQRAELNKDKKKEEKKEEKENE